MLYDYRRAPLSAADRALCDFAVKLTLDPAAMNEGDVARLREFGFDDAAVTIAVQVIAYFNYINRIAEGLGVDPESWMMPPKEEWDRRRARNPTSA